MKKMPFIVAIVGSLFSTNLKAETVLYCQSELTVGFVKDEGSWRTGNFGEKRYTVKFRNDFSRLDGISEKPWKCSWAWNDSKYGIVNCVHPFNNGEYFHYNKDLKRFMFLSTSSTGYLEDMEKADTNNIKAGSCKKF